MKDATLKQTGVVLTIVGAIALMIATGLMISSFQGAQAGPSSASELANGVSLSFVQSALGMPLFLTGIVLLILSWLRGHNPKRFMINHEN